jgi:ferrous iron transport protein A
MSEAIASATLDRLEPGSLGRIVRLEGAGPVHRRLMELGLVPGTEVRVVRRAPLGDPIELEVRGVRLALRRTEARTIHVERI